MSTVDAVTTVPTPVNEPVLQYAPGSPEREELLQQLKRRASEQVELTMTIGGVSDRAPAPGWRWCSRTTTRACSAP